MRLTPHWSGPSIWRQVLYPHSPFGRTATTSRLALGYIGVWRLPSAESLMAPPTARARGAAGEGQRSLARRAQGRRCRGQPEGGRGRDEHAATIPQALECENMLMGIFRSCTKHQLNSHLIMSGHKIGAVHVYLAHPRDLADHLARRRAFLPRGFWPRVFLSGPTKRAQGTRIGVMSHENDP